MQTKAHIGSAEVSIDEDGDLKFSSAGLRRLVPNSDFGVYVTREHADTLIEFIREWLDHDPDQELTAKVDEIRGVACPNFPSAKITRAIIAAVREHDAKYGSA